MYLEAECNYNFRVKPSALEAPVAKFYQLFQCVKQGMSHDEKQRGDVILVATLGRI